MSEQEELIKELAEKIENKIKDEFMSNLDICFLKKIIPENAEPKDFKHEEKAVPPSSGTVAVSYKDQKLYTMIITVINNSDVKVETVWSK